MPNVMDSWHMPPYAPLAETGEISVTNKGIMTEKIPTAKPIMNLPITIKTIFCIIFNTHPTMMIRLARKSQFLLP